MIVANFEEHKHIPIARSLAIILMYIREQKNSPQPVFPPKSPEDLEGQDSMLSLYGDFQTRLQILCFNLVYRRWPIYMSELRKYEMNIVSACLSLAMQYCSTSR